MEAVRNVYCSRLAQVLVWKLRIIIEGRLCVILRPCHLLMKQARRVSWLWWIMVQNAEYPLLTFVSLPSSVQASPESGCECSSWFVLRPSNGRSQKSKSGQSVLVVSHLYFRTTQSESSDCWSFSDAYSNDCCTHSRERLFTREERNFSRHSWFFASRLQQHKD